ncbi:MAG: DinB family protein [Paenibacillaceae bacterium]|nr:DinB family protein [Paenibacillaceae bacterium]
MNLEQRRAWNGQHKQLNGSIGDPGEHARAVELFLGLHAWLYAAEISGSAFPTYEDSVMDYLDDGSFRMYPAPSPDTKNSIAWHLWHLARVEDMTMNFLVAGGRQVLHEEDWLRRMNLPFCHSGNAMVEKDVAELSAGIHLEELLAYRIAVGRQTRQIITALKPGAFRDKVRPERVERLFEEGAVLHEAKGIADYWGKKTVGGLVLMPATRHHLVHLNRCAQIKQKLQNRVVGR